jgi:hypothetical protein
MDAIKTSDDFERTQDESTIKADAPPWEMIEAGRYRPRRIRGSCRGRELG